MSKSTRGFASMDPERQKKIATKGGHSVPNEKRSFSQDRALAAAAGRKGGLKSQVVRKAVVTTLALLCLAVLLPLAGCTAAEQARTFNFGQQGRVTCYDGGVVHFDDFSTGRIEKHESSDGFYFVSSSTGRLTEITGDCVVDYGVSPGAGFKPIRR